MVVGSLGHLLLHWTGGDNVSGPIYGEWSGFLSVFIPPLITVAGLVLMYWWHHRCHNERFCWMLGKHQYQNGTYTYCRKHHPDVARTAA